MKPPMIKPPKTRVAPNTSGAGKRFGSGDDRKLVRAAKPPLGSSGAPKHYKF